MALVNRKFVSGQEEVSTVLETATLIGTNVIEVLWHLRQAAPARLVGFSIPKVKQSTNNFDIELNTDVKWIESILWFWPSEAPKDSEDKLCYGYVYDTPENRMRLAKSFKTGWYRIVDQNIRDEVKALAIKNGIPTEFQAKPELGVKYTVREKTAMSEVEKLKQKNAELEKKIMDIIESGTVKLEKPLSGIKIKNRDEKQEGLRGDAN